MRAGPAFIVRHWWQLPGRAARPGHAVRRGVLPLEVPVNASLVASAWRRSTLGRELERAADRARRLLFTVAFNVMIFTIGWHYTKQVFGCMMVYAHYDGYPLSRVQRS